MHSSALGNGGGLPDASTSKGCGWPFTPIFEILCLRPLAKEVDAPILELKRIRHFLFLLSCCAPPKPGTPERRLPWMRNQEFGCPSWKQDPPNPTRHPETLTRYAPVSSQSCGRIQLLTRCARTAFATNLDGTELKRFIIKPLPWHPNGVDVCQHLCSSCARLDGGAFSQVVEDPEGVVSSAVITGTSHDKL